MTGTAPVLFIGHGSPMNLVQDNAFTRHLRTRGQALGTPRAVRVVSAHWLTEGQLAVSVDAHNDTLHDFGGFPARLYALRYPAPGAPAWPGRLGRRLRPAGQEGPGRRRPRRPAATPALGPHGERAVPFPEHCWPMLTALGAAQSHERPQHVFEGFQSGTLSMRCVPWG